MTRNPAACAAALLASALAACGSPGTEGDQITDETAASSGDANMASSGSEAAEVTDDDVASDVVAVAAQDGRFDTLVAAVEAAGLSDTLRQGEITLLAPTDDAFDQLGPDATQQLLMVENRDQLAIILQYHVLENAVTSGDIDGMIDAQTMAGDALSLERIGDRVQVGGAGGAVVTDADIRASNGVIHVIDTVLIPPAD